MGDTERLPPRLALSVTFFDRAARLFPEITTELERPPVNPADHMVWELPLEMQQMELYMHSLDLTFRAMERFIQNRQLDPEGVGTNEAERLAIFDALEEQLLVIGHNLEVARVLFYNTIRVWTGLPLVGHFYIGDGYRVYEIVS